MIQFIFQHIQKKPEFVSKVLPDEISSPSANKEQSKLIFEHIQRKPEFMNKVLPDEISSPSVNKELSLAVGYRYGLINRTYVNDLSYFFFFLFPQHITHYLFVVYLRFSHFP